MPKCSPVTIVNVGYRSTNYWVVSAGISRLLVELRWPDAMGWMRANLERMDVPLEDPEVVLASWQSLRERGANDVYPGHGPVRPVDGGAAFE